MDTPLIWTTRGNVPVDSLRYEHRWEDTEQETTFTEFWFAEDGELVKNNCHKLAKRQLTIGGDMARMG